MTLTDDIMDKVADTLMVWANDNAENMRVLLRERLKHKRTESNLAQSIQVNEPTIQGGVVSLTIDLNDYWAYIDLGVKGLMNKSAVGIPTKTYTSKDYPSGFSFRNMATPPQMINSLQNFIARKGISARVDNESSRQVIQTSFQMAQSMADAIKIKGIDGTRFYSDTFTNQSVNELTDKLSIVIGQQVELRIITEIKK